MKVIDLLKISKKSLEILSNCDIKASDWRHIELYEEFNDMKEKGCKVSYIVAVLSSKYKISEASVYRVIRRLKSTINHV